MQSTRTKKRQAAGRNEVDLWDDFWTAVSAAFAEHQQMATSVSVSVSVSAQSATQRMVSTNSSAHAAQAPTTTLTVTISTTILSTTFITAPIPQSTGLDGKQLPTLTPARPTTFETASSFASRSPPPTWTSTIVASGATGTSLQAPISPTATRGFQTDSPSSVTTSAGALATDAANATTTSTIGASAGHSEQKKAIVGGLSASIAGLLLIGVVICLLLRRRRPRTESKDFGDWSSEKGTRPPSTLVRKWTGGLVAAVGRRSPKQTPERPMSMVTVSVDEDHRIIRMNTKHWVRPYAPGAGEGYRESAPPGELRVVNPDPSRPASPARLLSDSASSFMKKQRTGLTGLVFGTSRPLTSQRQYPLSASQMPPAIRVVDPALSRECIATYEHTPSFRSYPSVSSVPIVQPYTVDDPSLTPPQEDGGQLGTPNAATPTDNKRPSLAALQGAAGSASRTLSHLSSRLLHPFWSKPSTPAVQRNSHYSTSTELSASSRRSDPFDLDAPSVMHPSPNPNGGGKYGPSADGNWTVYEGT
ncbi:hypothetical protein DOTSEDRAFT_73139 [Dothistroma septosporum NZE10]|uniref:Mid2 domain-containing protein n=1 Tax=Dothistroma septosporum (strain NZE10 / CBS 128990) TaxID=675120 RepID=N1PLQ5_DOTSN|nr:hypothetical protein DOTSEDRAFT_73139 [Dothistroma septosporum NZE10]